MKEWVVNDPSRLIVGHNVLHVYAVYLMGCVPRVYSVHPLLGVAVDSTSRWQLMACTCVERVPVLSVPNFGPLRFILLD